MQAKEGITISFWKDSDGQGLIIVKNEGVISVILIEPEILWACNAEIDWTTCGAHPYGEVLKRLKIEGGHRKLLKQAKGV
jgi:hypothetical protein